MKEVETTRRENTTKRESLETTEVYQDETRRRMATETRGKASRAIAVATATTVIIRHIVVATTEAKATKVVATKGTRTGDTAMRIPTRKSATGCITTSTRIDDTADRRLGRGRLMRARVTETPLRLENHTMVGKDIALRKSRTIRFLQLY